RVKQEFKARLSNALAVPPLEYDDRRAAPRRWNIAGEQLHDEVFPMISGKRFEKKRGNVSQAGVEAFSGVRPRTNFDCQSGPNLRARVTYPSMHRQSVGLGEVFGIRRLVLRRRLSFLCDVSRHLGKKGSPLFSGVRPSR
ncbi:MAG: hypothetical protein KF805_14050, partial [Phycisphaeraceae bacterium]|nr:hypothetical protein [Phycisphaeraceae bacterium]